MSMSRRKMLAAAIAAPLAAVAAPVLAKPDEGPLWNATEWKTMESGRFSCKTGEPVTWNQRPDDYYGYNPHVMPILDKGEWDMLSAKQQHDLVAAYATDLAHYRRRDCMDVKEAGKIRRMSEHCKLIDEKCPNLYRCLNRSQLFDHLLHKGPKLHRASGIQLDGKVFGPGFSTRWDLRPIGYGFKSEFNRKYSGSWTHTEQELHSATLFSVYSHHEGYQAIGQTFIVSTPLQLSRAYGCLDKIQDWDGDALPLEVEACLVGARAVLLRADLDPQWPDNLWAIHEKEWEHGTRRRSQ